MVHTTKAVNAADAPLYVTDQAVTILLAFCNPNFSIASSRILYFNILPAAFIGKEDTKSTYLGTL